MSQEISPQTSHHYGLKRVCEALGVARSSVYRQREHSPSKDIKRRGPLGVISDINLLKHIREDITSSPFKGEGHRKVHARIRRQGTPIGKNRVLRLMREHQLLSPHRNHTCTDQGHDGKIITSLPNQMWCSDGMKVRTVKEGWVWVFAVEEHWNGECLGWHVCKNGDRFAAFEAISKAVKSTYGSFSKGIAEGLKLRIDNGCQYTSDYFLKQLKYLGIEESFGLIRQPQTNGVAERFNRTMKEQIINGRIYESTDDLRKAVGEFIEVYNEKWLLGKLGYKSPRQARREYKSEQESDYAA